LGFNPKIIILDQAETPLHHLSLETESIVSSAKYNVVADIRNKEALSKVFKLYKPDVVFHAAAYKHVPLMEENPSQHSSDK
jgi:FlaA1/EpsC-like NDP-sugar epimerase